MGSSVPTIDSRDLDRYGLEYVDETGVVWCEFDCR